MLDDENKSIYVFCLPFGLILVNAYYSLFTKSEIFLRESLAEDSQF